MKKSVTVLLLICIVSLWRAQTNSIQNIGNLCIMNHETIAHGSYTTSQLQEMSFDSLNLRLNMASFVSNCHTKLFIVDNNGPLTSPSFSTFNAIYYSPELYQGNSISGRMNHDNSTDFALINAKSDIFTFRNLGTNPATFHRDSILNTFLASPTSVKLLKCKLSGTGPLDLVAFGIRAPSNPEFVIRSYVNITSTVTASNFSFVPEQLKIVAPGSWSNLNFDVEAADLDGNGRDELVFVSEALDTIYVLCSQSAIFDKVIKVPTGTGMVHKKIVIADINNDSKKEVAISSKLGGINYVNVFTPVVAGTIVSVAPTTGSVVANTDYSDFNFADLNGDGHKDLIVSMVTSTASTVGLINVYMYNRSASTPFQFSPSITFNVPNHFTGGIAVCDVDNNKRPDIISFANSQPSSVVVLKNFTFRDSLYTVPSRTNICLGDTIKLVDQLLGFPGQYMSTFNSSVAATLTHSTSITGGGSYTASASYSPYVGGECKFTSNPINLILGMPPVLTINSPTAACYNTNVILTAGGASSFTWATSAGTSTNNFLSLTPTANVVYYLAGTSIDGCKAVLPGTLTVNPDFNATITYDKNFLCKNQTAMLSANGGVSYTWSTGQVTPDIIITQSTSVAQTYSVVVTNSDGCIKYATFNTNYNDKCKEVIVKTGIVPNGSGENAYLYIENIENYPDNVVSVYNRWGKQLFTQKGYDNKTKTWPTKEEHNLMSGTYYYVLELGPGNPVQKGWVEIFSN